VLWAVLRELKNGVEEWGGLERLCDVYVLRVKEKGHGEPKEIGSGDGICGEGEEMYLDYRTRKRWQSSCICLGFCTGARPSSCTCRRGLGRSG
jgi:hypothetical protein